MDHSIKLHNHLEAQSLFGSADENIKIIEKEFRIKTALRGDHLKISGTNLNIKKAARFIETLLNDIRNDRLESMHQQLLAISSGHVKKAHTGVAESLQGQCAHVGPKTQGQREYVDAIRNSDMVFGIGPAGTGKTYLAVASAVEALKKNEVRRIILTRPAIEAGESLGFLPGDMYEKISPYLRPLYDALYDMIEAERIEKYLETGIIEVAPLAYMRGRTLNDAFIILDEAQNCTAEQMKMFLTRLGFDSKAVITGDPTQSDLPDGKPTGLLQARDILKEVNGIKFIYFSGLDVVRHALVQSIIEAYDKAKNK